MSKPATFAPTHDVVRDFGARHRAVKRALLVALIGWGAAVISVMAASMHMASPWAPMTATAVAILLTVPYARAGSRYRCPACGAKPSTGDGDPGMLLNPPPQCGGCGVRLTWGRSAAATQRRSDARCGEGRRRRLAEARHARHRTRSSTRVHVLPSPSTSRSPSRRNGRR